MCVYIYISSKISQQILHEDFRLHDFVYTSQQRLHEDFRLHVFKHTMYMHTDIICLSTHTDTIYVQRLYYIYFQRISFPRWDDGLVDLHELVVPKVLAVHKVLRNVLIRSHELTIVHH
jgi:hypothetical protein